MDKIQLKDIDINKLDILNKNGQSSTIYLDNDKCIKIFKNYTIEERKVVYRKLDEINCYDLPSVIIPETLIMDDQMLVGYISEYFNGVSIYEKYNKRYINTKELFDLMYKVSKSLFEEIHMQDIICSDLNFFNILVDEKGNFKFIDFDDWIIEESNMSATTGLIHEYMLKYRRNQIIIDRNLDRLSMILSFFDLIFLKEVQNISNKNYKYLEERLNTIKNMRTVFETLKSKKKSLDGNLWYLFDYIDKNDDYVIDRHKLMKRKEIVKTSF